MRIKHLLLMAVALPLLFVACKQNDPVDEVKNPTIELTAGEATEFTLSFTINTTEAESVAWLAIESSEATPTASEVLANGTKVEANKSVECTATGLEDGTEYTIVAAVKNSKAVDKKEIKMTTIAATEETTHFKRTSEAEVEFTAEGGKGEIEYEIVNPIEGTEVEAEADVEWIAVTVGEKISFIVEGNTTTEAREGKITAKYGELSFDVKVKQAAKPNDQPVDEEVNFTASVYEVQYYGTEYSAAYNYLVYLSDTGLNEDGIYKQNGEYYMLDIYAADSAENNSYTLPNGKYTASETPNAGTFGIGDYGAHIKVVDGVPTYTLYKQGTVTVSDGKIEAKIMMEDGTVHNVLYEGNLRFDGKEPDDPDQPVGPADVELTADKWLWNGSSSYGNKYQVVGEGFSIDVHFPAQFAKEDSLTAGDYTWTTTTMFGYNDFDNEFTTRSFTVDGVSVPVDSGSAKVTVEGEAYAIELVLNGRDGVKYLIVYNGKLNEKEDVGGSEIVITSLAEGVFNSSYGWYTFKGSNDTVTFDLIVNDYQSTATFIEAGSFNYAPMKSFSGSEGFFFVDNFKMDGIKYKPQVNSTMVVTNDGANVGITLNLFMDSGDELVVVYNGPIGDGGSTPAEPTKLDTPSVSGLVSGNAATISWQAIAGAKDYSVSLNGTFLQTVETAYIVLNDLEYSTTYSVSVVANPADSSVNTASDAGTASFTTEADPNAGGDEPGGDEPATDFIDWHFSAHYNTDNCVVTLTGKDDSRVITVKTNDLAFAKFYADTTRSNYFTDATVDGVATSDVTAESYVHVQQTQVSINLVINGITYTGNSDGFSY
ncbi:MAG: hypothetical protein E7126_01135 [Rikenellaceae bacterium]|nr:hypothetical protein [Rikenellaceae bacterium]